MSKNAPNVLLEKVDKQTYKCDQIIEATGIWAVYFKNVPFNLKTSHYLTNDSPAKYARTAFANPGHAKNLCKKLNLQFKTTDFSVVLLNSGEQIYPNGNGINSE